VVLPGTVVDVVVVEERVAAGVVGVALRPMGRPTASPMTTRALPTVIA
jgi:hypothetical protein